MTKKLRNKQRQRKNSGWTCAERLGAVGTNVRKFSKIAQFGK